MSLSANLPSVQPHHYNIFDEFTDGFIDCEKLKRFIDKFTDSVLLIDVRPRDEFNKSHILAKNIICMEPVSLVSKKSDADLENLAMLTAPDSEQVLFQNRSDFALVVLYDNNSNKVMQSEDIIKLKNILANKSFQKPLERIPVILSGGIFEWLSKYGVAGYQHNHGQLTPPVPSLSRRSSISSHSFSTSPIARNMNEYLSHPVKNDFKASNQATWLSQQQQQHSASPLPKQSSGSNSKSPFRIPALSRSPSRNMPQGYTSPTPISIPSAVPQFSSIPSISSFASSPQISSSPSPIPMVNLNHTNGGSINNNGNNNLMNNSNGQILTSSSNVQVTKKPGSIQRLYCTTGLCNLGNSCYMNCIIQCLLGTIPLIQVFIDGTYKRYVNINSKLGTKGIMAKFFAELSLAVYQKTDSIYEPKNFKIAVGSINSTFRNNNQQDCSEFLNFVLDSLHEDLNESGSNPRPKELTEQDEELRESMPLRLASTIEWERYLKTDFSAIVSYFQGQYSSQLKCLECGKTSTTFQSFSVLSLPIPEQFIHSAVDKIPLEKCFEEFTKLEILDGDDCWFCPRCKQLRKSTKKITITRFPSNLIIHLKRFKNYIGPAEKITNFVQYPFELDLTSYWPEVVSKEEEIQLLNFPPRGQLPPFKFALYGVANHTGTLASGHYTAYVWKGVNKKWCYFDDTRVVKNVAQTSVVNPNAYVLFYTRTK